MSAKDDAVAAFVSAVQQGETQVLSTQGGALWDQAESQGNGPGFTQADIDSAVATAVGPLNDQITALQAQDASDVAAGQTALAAAQSSMASLQSNFDALSAKEAPEAAVISGLQGSLSSLQAAVATLAGLVPAPSPAPTSP